MTIWFKQRRYGFGAYPASWQGWALTAAYVVGMIAAAVMFAPPAGEPQTMRFFVIAGALTIVFVAIAWRTTEDGWRWRWGKD